MSRSSDPDEIRKKAYDLLNQIGPEDNDDKAMWPEQPSPPRSYQHQKTIQRDNRDDDDCKIGESREIGFDVYQHDPYGGGITGFLIKSISDLCKETPDPAQVYEILKQIPQFLSATSNDTVDSAVEYYNSRRSPSTEGSYEKIPVLNSYQGSSVSAERR